MKKLIPITLVLFFAAFTMHCGGGEDTAKKAEKTTAEKPTPMAESGAYMAMEVTNGGTVKGTVTFAGAIPAKKRLEITKDVNVCGKQPHFNEDLVVAGNKGLANVVVSLANINKGKAISTLGEAFELDQQGCAFKPHVVIVPAGAELTILNNDGILHNIHTYSEINSPINMAQPGFKKKMVQTFDEAEVIRVACDVHNWMGGYIVVVDHPYYALTDANGNFEITDVPPGTYTVEYWQETLGKQTKEVTVTAGETVDATMEYAVGS
ncbi:MAG: carboxypeptidase regulatory-like domain-containing protein [bacterium]